MAKRKPQRIKTGGGRFNPDAEFIYFIAGYLPRVVDAESAVGQHTYRLIPCDEVLKGRINIGVAIEQGFTVLLDSGVYAIAAAFSRDQGLPIYEARATDPARIDGYDELVQAYISTVKEHEADVWGYVEVDLGSEEQKRATRAMLEKEGLRPIPVYHPLFDSWDYFDELCQRYDRVCVANFSGTETPLRKRLLMTLWERARLYPDVWIHLLGYTPSEWIVACPMANSTDSSSWAYMAQYGALAQGPSALLKRFFAYGHGFAYETTLDYEDESKGFPQAIRLYSYNAQMMQRVWRRHYSDLTALFPDAEARHDREPVLERPKKEAAQRV